MTGAGGRPRDFVEFQRWVKKELTALSRRQIPRSATTDPVVPITTFSAVGLTVGADGASRQRVNGFVHIRAHVLRSAAETGLLFVLPEGERPAAVEWTLAHDLGTLRGMVRISPDGQVVLANSLTNGAFVFSHTFPVIPVAP